MTGKISQPRMLREQRIYVRCQADEGHVKILRFRPEESLALLVALAALLDGTSPAYIFPPAEGSPIGRCAICGARLECEIKPYKREEPEPDVNKQLQNSLAGLKNMRKAMKAQGFSNA